MDGEYIATSIIEDINVRMENEVMLGLRKFKGINLDVFRSKYKRDLMDVFNTDDLIRDGYLVIEDNYLRISSEYMYISNEIIVRMFE